MGAYEEDLVKRTLERFRNRISFASMFGSYVRGEHDDYSDLDVFVVCRDREDEPFVNEALTSLSRRIGRRIHVNIYAQNLLEERVRHHDYLIASILEDSIPIIGEINLEEARSRILNGVPNSESINFNIAMGRRILARTESRLRGLKKHLEAYQPITITRDHIKENMLRFLEDYQVALGYLTASLEMNRLCGVITFRRLLSLDSGFPLRRILMAERSLRRGWKAPASLLQNEVLENLTELTRVKSGGAAYRPTGFLRNLWYRPLH